MKIQRLALIALLIPAVLLPAAVADARQEGENQDSLKQLGFKYYWSLLDADQRMQAKEIIAEHVANTAADRAAVAAMVAGFRAEVVALLTRAQLRRAGKIRSVLKSLSREQRAAVFDRLLDTTDRATFTDRVARLGEAGPEDRVRIGVELLDQVMDMYLAEYGPRLELTREQESRFRELYAELKTDLQPALVRLSVARAGVIEQATGILTEEQRGRIGTFKDTVMEKVLGWLRG